MNSFSYRLKCTFQDTCIKKLSTFPKNAKIMRWLRDNRVTIGTSYKIERWHVSDVKKTVFLVRLQFLLSLQSAFVLQPYLLFGNKYDNRLTNTLLKVVSHKRTTTSKHKKARLSFSYNTIFISTFNASE